MGILTSLQILSDYKKFLNDTGKKDNKQTKKIFKKEYIIYYVKMFGVNDLRTQNVIDILKDF